MKTLFALGIAAATSLALAAPAAAITITARVTGGPIAIYAGPGDRTGVVGQLPDGAEIPIDRCQYTDRDSLDTGRSSIRSGPFYRTEYCQIPGYGWVPRSYIVGRGLINVTPPNNTTVGRW